MRLKKDRKKIMVKKIVKGKNIFLKKAKPATEEDRQVVTDLIDTYGKGRIVEMKN